MRIACLQFDPKLGKVAANQARADRLLHAELHVDPDILLLPEMAFTGYAFRSRDEILPYCESPHDGPTATWCRRVARARRCPVVCGFPERATEERLYNSLLVCDRQGDVVHVYRKHFLYTTDETWAAEGPGFEHIDLPGLGSCALGICMDLNPRKFEAPFDRFEFASALFEPELEHHEKPQPGKHRLRSNLVLLCNNWLRSSQDVALGDAEHTHYLHNYWAHRLLPALGQAVIVAIANRVGRERGTVFAGASCVLDLKKREVLASLDGVREGVLLCEDAPEYGSARDPA